MKRKSHKPRKPTPRDGACVRATIRLSATFVMLAGVAACSKQQTLEEQIAHGAALYREHCAHCHEAERGIGPKLTKGVLASRVTAKDLYTYTRRYMPQQAAGTLTEQQYWDITAYVLSRHDLLGDHVLDAARSEGLTLKK